MLVQGVGVCGSGWQPQVEALASRHECLTFDHRGLGKSRPYDEAGTALTVERMASDTLALMDEARFTRAHLVGHSLGGLVALAVAIGSPQRVLSLSLLCTFARGRDAGPPTPRMIFIGARTRIGTLRSRRHAFLELLLPPASFASLSPAERESLAGRLAPLFGHDLGELPSAANRQLAAMRRFDATSRLLELAALRTLVVSGKHDLIAPPRLGRALAAGIPGARYAELENAAHGVPLHSPDVVNALLMPHLGAP